MARCGLPKDIVFDMQMAGVLPASAGIIAGKLEGTQPVECTREMAQWCRQRADQDQDPERARLLRAAADTIERALKAEGR